MNTIQGKVKTVARTGGIILEEKPDVWYNPIEAAKEHVKPELKGKQVELTLLEADPKKFQLITEIQGTQTKIQEEKIETRPDHQRLIVRQCALKAAVEYLKDNKEPVELGGVLFMAEEFESWVFR